MNKLMAWLRIIRPPIVIISILGSLACYLLSEPDSNSWNLILLAAVAGFISAGLMVDNDVWDLPSDRVRRRSKPLCSGAISVRQAHIAGYIFMSLAGGLAIFMAWPALLYVWSMLAVGAWYNRRGKLSHIWGNTATAYGVGGIVLLPMLYAGEYRLFPLFLGIFIQEIGREIMVGIGDVEGDRAAGWRTLPVLVGRYQAQKIAGLFYLLGIPWFLLQPDLAPIYYAGAAAFALILTVGWFDTREKIVIGEVRNDPSIIFRAYERDLRLWSRLGVLIFQVCILLAAVL